MVVLLVAAACAARLPYLGRPLSPDESGYLVVARSWSAGGHSLYGPYWVDRPPLLLEIYRLAGAWGGHLAIRLFGMAAAAAVVLFVVLAARRAAGRVGAVWAGVAAVALLSSPVLGPMDSNGELLAAPFVAVGVWSVTELVVRRSRWQVAGLSALTGASGVAAVLVKQNMVDVAVFYLLALLGLTIRGLMTRSVALRSLWWCVLGACAGAAPVIALAMAWGSRPGAMFFAAYPFRVEAAVAMSHQVGAARWGRAGTLVAAEALSFGPVVLALLLLPVVTRRMHVNAPVGVVVATSVIGLAAYAVVSIASGGSYWHHYLVQLAVPTALASGLVCSSTRAPRGRLVVSALVVSAVVAWSGGLAIRPTSPGQVVGAVVRHGARPGDTIVSAFGNADVVLSSGLRSPYPYLWSVPTRVLDPSLRRFATLLAGPRAPTWLVVHGPGTDSWLHTVRAGAVLDRRYHPLALLCGREVYVRDGFHRSLPGGAGGRVPTVPCRAPAS